MRRPKETVLIAPEGQRLLVIDADSLMSILTHYTDGKVPLDIIVKQISFSQYFNRMIGILCESSQWQDGSDNLDRTTGILKPLQIRYEGKKVLGWHTNTEEEPEWENPPDAPKRQ